ncbi:MAG: hypothetical protein AB7U29_16475 [Desulfobulbus sp.]
MPFGCCFAIGALLYFCVNMLDNFFKNDVDFRPPFMSLARNVIQHHSAESADLNLGNGDRFFYAGITDQSINPLPFALTCRMNGSRFVFFSLRRR